jgi:hypothetical protein
MRRRKCMHKVLAVLILAIGLTTALAIELPLQGSLTLISSAGEVVGVGEFEDGELELELLADFAGLVTFTSVDAEGNVVVFDASVAEGGVVTLIDTVTLEFVGLGEAVAAVGGEIEISFEDELDADDLDEDENGDNEEEVEDEEDAEDDADAAGNSDDDADDADDESDDADSDDSDGEDSDGDSDDDDGSDDEEDEE